MEQPTRGKLLIFETHPIPYRAPIFSELNRILPNSFEVVYGSDFSVRGYSDKEFGCTVSWGRQLLDGYDFRILNNERGGGIEKRAGISGKGVRELIKRANPSAILLHSFGYHFCTTALWSARRYRIPVWIRTETQENANFRSRVKQLSRSIIYRLLYKQVSIFFSIGTANREHYRKFGVTNDRIRTANYCTPNSIAKFTPGRKESIRVSVRTRLGIDDNKFIVLFVGKLIDKKNPRLLLDAWSKLPPDMRALTELVFVGTGELESELKRISTEVGIPSYFVGFVNQVEISDYYLAADMLVLPSRRMGETWGLVVNEALDAGCAVATSDAVGCSVDFGGWERVRVFPDGNSGALSNAIIDLRQFPHDFSWAVEKMKAYSVNAAANSFANEMLTKNYALNSHLSGNDFVSRCDIGCDWSMSFL